MLIKAGDKYPTRDGRKAYILTTERKHPDYPVVALVQDRAGFEEPLTYTRSGLFDTSREETGADLILKPAEFYLCFHYVVVDNRGHCHFNIDYKRARKAAETYGSKIFKLPRQRLEEHQ